jgi:hypothetical protein
MDPQQQPKLGAVEPPLRRRHRHVAAVVGEPRDILKQLRSGGVPKPTETIGWRAGGAADQPPVACAGAAKPRSGQRGEDHFIHAWLCRLHAC